MAIEEVAIVGAGLCGLALAIALQRTGVSVTIYEFRPEDAASTPGGIMLSPNGLRSLDAMGIYERIKPHGYQFQDGTFRSNHEHKFIDSYEMGNEKRYGYDAMRIYRQVLLDELRAMVREAGIHVCYQKRFSHIVSEEGSGVRFACTDGSEYRADILIGADGIHSTVRRHLFPEIEPEFSNIMSIITAIPTSAVQFPFASYHLPSSIHGDAGAFILAPQGGQGEELMLAIQQRTHVRDKTGWKALRDDKPYLLSLMRQGYEQWNTLVQSALDAVDPEKIFVWPFYTVPKLSTWRSASGKVVILGDAAHAIPPAAGQGINQGFEDVHSLALLLAAVNEKKADWDECLQWWQTYRQRRVDGATELTMEMNRRRLPSWTGEGTQSIDNSGMYGVQVADDVQCWLANRSH